MVGAELLRKPLAWPSYSKNATNFTVLCRRWNITAGAKEGTAPFIESDFQIA
jgi:hypothetical protein